MTEVGEKGKFLVSALYEYLTKRWSCRHHCMFPFPSITSRFSFVIPVEWRTTRSRCTGACCIFQSRFVSRPLTVQALPRVESLVESFLMTSLPQWIHMSLATFSVCCSSSCSQHHHLTLDFLQKTSSVPKVFLPPKLEFSSRTALHISDSLTRSHTCGVASC